MKVFCASLFFLFSLTPGSLSQGVRGALEVTIRGEKYPVYQRSYALLIGIGSYSNGWPALSGIRDDLYKIRTALEKQGFNVLAIWDPDKDHLDDAITSFIQSFGQDRQNRLVIYYAGHGYTAVSSYGEAIGYLVPVDAPRPHLDFGNFQARAVEMAQFDLYSKRIQSNHVLFVFDACFSGSLFTGKTLPAPLSPAALEPVRQCITSGSADEQVPDKSIFCDQFIRALEGEGDYDRDGYITGTELGEYLQKSVINYSRNTQHPQYGKIRNPLLDKGEIIFVSTQSAVTNTQSAAATPQSTLRSSQPLDIAPPTLPGTTSTTSVTQTNPSAQSRIQQMDDLSGELKVTTTLTGDLYIDQVFYRTLVASTTVMLMNVPTGSRMLTLRGATPWEKEVEIRRSGVTIVEIKP